MNRNPAAKQVVIIKAKSAVIINFVAFSRSFVVCFKDGSVLISFVSFAVCVTDGLIVVSFDPWLALDVV